MRILHTGDWHISTRHPRYRTLGITLGLLAEAAAQSKPDAICIAGDIMELHPDAADIRAVQYWLSRFAGIAPVICVRGNHDPEGWYEVLRQTDTLHSVTLVTEPSSFALLRPTGEAEEEEVCRLDHSGGDLTPPDMLGVVHCLPWVAKGPLLAGLRELPPSETSDAVALELARQILRGFRASTPEGVPSVLLAHADLSGAKTDAGQPSVGAGMKLSVHDLMECDAHAIMLGHLHARQTFIESSLIGYAGSPCRLTWGEAGADAKGGLLWSISAESGLCTAEPVDVPSPRLWCLEGEYRPEDQDDPEGVPGGFIAYDLDEGEDPCALVHAAGDDELRFRYHFPEDQRQLAEARVEKDIKVYWPGPRDLVTPDPVTVPTAHARVPEIATETDPQAMFERWIAAEGIDLSPGRRLVLRGLIHEAIEAVRP